MISFIRDEFEDDPLMASFLAGIVALVAAAILFCGYALYAEIYGDTHIPAQGTVQQREYTAPYYYWVSTGKGSGYMAYQPATYHLTVRGDTFSVNSDLYGRCPVGAHYTYNDQGGNCTTQSNGNLPENGG